MPDNLIRIICSQDIRRTLYFTFDSASGALELVTPDSRYELTVAAAEDLKDNFDVNLIAKQDHVNRDGKKTS
jgi:hypothetical protein